MKVRHEIPTLQVERPQIVLQQRVVIVAVCLFGLANLLLLRELHQVTGGFGFWSWVAFCLPFAVMGGAIRLVESPSEASKEVTHGTSDAVADPVHATASLVSELREAVDGRGKTRILLVDDNAVNRRVARLLLEKAGYFVEEARDGIEACEFAAAARFDLILMDVHMPRRNGFEATRAIRASEDPGAHTPILAMTARAMGDDVRECLDAGMDGYVGKPVRGPALLAAVESWVEMDTHSDSTLVLDEQDNLDELPILAPGALDELRSYGDGEDDSILLELANMFFRGADDNIATMRETLASGDLHRFGRAAHSLKGSSGTLGARRLAERCRQIEENARNGRFPASADELEQLAGMVDQIRGALESNLGIQLV